MYITNQFEGGNSEAPKASNGKPNPNPPHPNPKALLRSTTLSQRPTISSTQSTKTTKVNQKLATNISSNKQTNATTTPSNPQTKGKSKIIIQFNKIQNSV